MDERLMGTCRAKTGMLVLKDCGRPAAGVCSSCGKPVCGRHKCDTGRGTSCPDCAATIMKSQAIDPRARGKKKQPATPPPGGAQQIPFQQPPGAANAQAAGAAGIPGAARGYDASQRAWRRNDWYDNSTAAAYMATPYFFSHRDYSTFDQTADTWTGGSGHINSSSAAAGAPVDGMAQEAVAEGRTDYDPTES